MRRTLLAGSWATCLMRPTSTWGIVATQDRDHSTAYRLDRPSADPHPFNSSFAELPRCVRTAGERAALRPVRVTRGGHLPFEPSARDSDTEPACRATPRRQSLVGLTHLHSHPDPRCTPHP